MPIYEYRCAACEAVSEFVMKMSDPAPSTCPRCGKTGPMTKKMSMTSFQLQGGGWYNEGYAGSTNKKSETKPAATTTEAPKAPAKPSSDT